MWMAEEEKGGNYSIMGLNWSLKWTLWFIYLLKSANVLKYHIAVNCTNIITWLLFFKIVKIWFGSALGSSDNNEIRAITQYLL